MRSLAPDAGPLDEGASDVWDVWDVCCGVLVRKLGVDNVDEADVFVRDSSESVFTSGGRDRRVE